MSIVLSQQHDEEEDEALYCKLEHNALWSFKLHLNAVNVTLHIAAYSVHVNS